MSPDRGRLTMSIPLSRPALRRAHAEAWSTPVVPRNARPGGWRLRAAVTGRPPCIGPACLPAVLAEQGAIVALRRYYGAGLNPARWLGRPNRGWIDRVFSIDGPSLQHRGEKAAAPRVGAGRCRLGMAPSVTRLRGMRTQDRPSSVTAADWSFRAGLLLGRQSSSIWMIYRVAASSSPHAPFLRRTRGTSRWRP